ncbi:MAG TPA: DUF1801 domain-containing protein [Luteibaculaceae bacterium]|nr:DUF1801 domain-containing protein [Luteibaculaceae bacterium]
MPDLSHPWILDYIRENDPALGTQSSALIDALVRAIPPEFEVRVDKGIHWEVPLSLYPDGYHCTPGTPLPFISLVFQKNHVALYHMGLYADESLNRWFDEQVAKVGLGKLDRGKSCIRFKHHKSIPVELLADLCAQRSALEWIQLYETQFKR